MPNGELEPSGTTRSTDEPANPSPTTTGAKKPGRFVFVDALRGIAALGVVVYHAHSGKHLVQVSAKLPGWALWFLESGHFGVPIFFVLSGFVIAHSASRYRVDLPFIGRFILRRSIRLDPPYWFSIALVLAFRSLSRVVMSDKSAAPITFGQVIAHLFYVQNILGYKDINPIYWTLALEIQFYLAFCLLMWLAHATRRDANDRRSLFMVFIPALMVAAIWPLGIYKGEIWPGLFPPFWHGFLLGMLACWGMNGTIRPAWFYAYAAILGAGAVWTPDTFTQVCVATSGLLMVASQAGGLGTWLNWRWLQFLGLISYSLYLIHNPVSGALYHIGYRITGRSPATEVAWFVVMILVNVAAAAATWWLVERPSLAFAHRLRLEAK